MSILLWLLLPLVIVYMIFEVINAAAGVGGVFALFGNPLAKKLGLQGQQSHGNYLLDREATVVSCPDDALRVELAGTTWSARVETEGCNMDQGARVRVLGVEGITLVVTPDLQSEQKRPRT